MKPKNSEIKFWIYGGLFVATLMVAGGCNEAPAPPVPPATPPAAVVETANLPPDIDTSTLEVLRELRDTWVKPDQK